MKKRLAIGGDYMTNTIIQSLIIQRYEIEYVNRSYAEMVSRFKYELNKYKNEKYIQMQKQLENYLSSNDWLNDAFKNRLIEYTSTGNINSLTKPLDMSDIDNGVADSVEKNSENGNSKETREVVMKNFNEVYKNFLELTNMLVNRLSYIFDMNI